MLTIKSYTDAEALKKYFEEHLEKGDYYSERGQVQGKWIGKLASELGLRPERVNDEHFKKLVDGINPQTGGKLTARANKLRVRVERDADGQKVVDPKTGRAVVQDKVPNRILSYDLVISAPKTVSIMAITLQDSRLLAAHEKAVEIAFQQLEKKAMTRVRKGLSSKSRESRDTGKLLGARFSHTSSRDLDPQLHTHQVVFNATFDPVEKRMKALDAYEIYAGSKLISEIYRNALAQEVRALGYEIEEGRHTWRIKGVPLVVEALFAKRAGQIETLAKQLEAKSGIQVDKRGRAVIARTTRAAKNKTMTDAELVHFQLAQLKPEERSLLEALKTQAQAREPALSKTVETATPLLGREAVSTQGAFSSGDAKSFPSTGAADTASIQMENMARDAIDYALNHVFERKSVVRRDELLRAALKHAAGRTSFEKLELELLSDRFIPRGRNGEDVMTREERARELTLLNFVREGLRMFDELGRADGLPKKLTTADLKAGKHGLSQEQQAAAVSILNSRDQITLLTGKAGVGKTHTLAAIVAQSSHPVIITAPSTGAVENLREDGFSRAMTTSMLLTNEKQKLQLPGALVVVDEAGLMSTKHMEALFDLVKEHNARMLLIGDSSQHNSVEGGDAFRLVEQFSRRRPATIGTIIRQKSEEYRDAVQALSQGKIAEGFSKLEKMKAIHQAGNETRPARVATEYATKTADGIKTLIVTPTWKEHERITQAVRFELKERGVLDPKDIPLAVFKSVNFTRVEKRYAPNFQAGLHVSFHSNRGEFRQGEVWQVVSSSERKVHLTNDRGVVRVIEPQQFARAFDVVEREEKSFAVGDRILMKANFASSPTNRIPNGAIRTIDAIERDGTIRLSGGKHLDPHFRHFTHGYAITSQASQGKDATHVIISADAKSPMALSKNQFYVSASRGKESISIYTNSTAQFRDAVERSAARELVLERLVRNGILKDKLLRLKVTYERSIEMSRDLIERAFVKFRDSARDREPGRSRTVVRDRSVHVEMER